MKHLKLFNEHTNINWWNENSQILIDLVNKFQYEDWLNLVKNKKDMDGVINSTAKHQAMYLFDTYSSDELMDIISEYNDIYN